MFLAPYRAGSIDSIFDNSLFPALGKWLDGETTDSQPFRVPRTNINETEKEYILTMEMPGVDKKNVRVEIENDEIVISGEKSEKVEAKGLLRREIRSEKFRRSFSLDSSIDREQIKARLENGVLTVTLPKKAEVVGRTIAIE